MKTPLKGDEVCAYCGESATGTVRIGRYGTSVPACALDKAAAERKNLYMPCVISADVDAMTPEEHARVLRETYWADNITNAEWPAVLRHDGVKAYAKSRLKKKAVGWVMALSRIVRLHPALGAQVLREADALYRRQIREEPPIPWATLADLIERGWGADGIDGWLQPLGNLASYGPESLHAMVEHFAESESAETWKRHESEAA